jgi:hypothetical protein
MSFETFLFHNYPTVCERLKSFEKDKQMKAMLHSGQHDKELAKSWMREYGLLQGITSQNREIAVSTFLEFASAQKPGIPSLPIDELYSLLLTNLHEKVNRGWLSATSKLLWCMFPDSIVIYDAFVERALIVMQCLDHGLAQFPRIGKAPKISAVTDISKATKFYMNYQSMVKHILERSSELLGQLRKQHSETYPHDIRIIDLSLWMIGNPTQEFHLGAEGDSKSLIR